MAPEFSLAYCTNIWNHYQAAICRALASRLGDRFQMCLYEPMNEERRMLGWDSGPRGLDWVIGPPTSKDVARQDHVTMAADVAILGQCPNATRRARARTGKLTFISTERYWKMPLYWWRFLNPRFLKGVAQIRSIANCRNVHYLPMGAGAATDARKIRCYGDRMWTWAYFTDVPDVLGERRHEGPIKLLWAGRMLPWKRVDLLLEAVAALKDDSRFGTLEIVGCGEEEERLKCMASRLHLGKHCVFHPPVSPAQVRAKMRDADAYVMPSGRDEGWGVVVNEAISEGCIVIANEEAGASRMLIRDRETGFLTVDGDYDGIVRAVTELMASPDRGMRIRMAAWRYLRENWSPEIAADRLLTLCGGLLGHSDMPCYADGPCSPALRPNRD